MTNAGTHAANLLDPRQTPAARPRLRTIRGVTYAVPDLDAVERAYCGVLGYAVRERGTLAPSLATAWGAPGMAGRPTLTLEPASGEPCSLRFVASPRASGWRALVTHGWNATEFVVQRVDELAARLADSPFVVIGPPTSLTRFPMIRAMQAIGPFGECCYFTQVGPGSGLDLASAESFVGRVFIAVAGGADVDAMFDPYTPFANDFDPPVATPVRVLSTANGLPLETLHRHGLVKVGSGTLVELDAYPAVTRPRAVSPGELPPGMAMVSLLVDRLPPHLETSTYDSGLGGPAALLRGRAGELIELVTA